MQNKTWFTEAVLGLVATGLYLNFSHCGSKQLRPIQLPTEFIYNGDPQAPQIQHGHNNYNYLTLLSHPQCLPGLAIPPLPPGLTISVNGRMVTQVAKP